VNPALLPNGNRVAHGIMEAMTLDGFVHQLHDVDPEETKEWVESLDAVIDARGKRRARFLLSKITERARERQVGSPAEVSTPYVNTIPTEEQPWFPGDDYLERRIRAYIRWNAAVMVVNANHHAEGIGGHLSTFASSAALYEVGFNHFFRGKEDGLAGDHVYVQGHAAPGIYARAYLERRFDEADLDNFRREVSQPGGEGSGFGGLSSYPHPWLMPEFWEYPTVSMGLGPINSIYQARFNRYLHNRHIDDTTQSRVWCFLGDGECDEPETLGSISLAARERLDNLTWVVNCNLQRLDGPVRGNQKIIQELESVFRGAGWNVIKVIWGSRWDALLHADVDGVLLKKMNATPDGDFQRYAVSDGAHIREHFFGPDPRLRKLVDHLSDDDLRTLPRGGHDYAKLYAAYQAATQQVGAPTVILAKTIKGWTLGPDLEGRNATHQIKKMTAPQLKLLRDRLYMHDEVPDEALEGDDPPYYRPATDSPEYRYMMDRRRALDGPLPSRVNIARRPLAAPSPGTFKELHQGSGTQAVSSTMAFTRLLRNLLRDGEFGKRVVPIVPDEARTFGMDSLFREFKIYASQGQMYTPVDNDLLLTYAESADGQILEEGITEAGSMSSWTAAGTSYAHRGVPMVPFFVFYSMFGPQRVGDLMWAAADARTRGFLLGATAGRTTLLGEGLQHQDGQSLLLASAIPTCQCYDPAFAYEMAAVIEHGIERMFGGEPATPDGVPGEDVFYYLTLYNENFVMPARPSHVSIDDIVSGLYRFSSGPDDATTEKAKGKRPAGAPRATILFSGTAQGAAREAQVDLAATYGIDVELWSATSYKRLREDALAVQRWNRLHPEAEPRTAEVTAKLAESGGPIVAVTDFVKALPDGVGRFVPKPFVALGTDGYGFSDTRGALRRHFEVDAPNIVIAVLQGLADADAIKGEVVAEAIARYDIDPDKVDPRLT
jgi:pyruvate dehydrogenase E1 component